MEPIASFALLEPDAATGKTRLQRDGWALPGLFDGLRIEAQYLLRDGTALVWLTDDCLFEEGLHIALIGPDGRVLDRITGGAPYTPACLEIVGTGTAHVDFRFFGGRDVLRLNVGGPRLRRITAPGFGYAGWQRSRYLSLEGAPPQGGNANLP